MPKTAPFFSMVRAALGPDLRGQGFVPTAAEGLRSLMLPWTRTEPDGRTLEICFQRHNKPWLVDLLGTEFMVNLMFLATGELGTQIWYLMEPGERERMRVIHERIVQRLPDFHEARDVLPGEIAVLEMEWKFINQAWNPNHSVWFRYRTADDLGEWLDFVREILPAVIERFLADRIQSDPR